MFGIVTMRAKNRAPNKDNLLSVLVKNSFVWLPGRTPGIVTAHLI